MKKKSFLLFSFLLFIRVAFSQSIYMSKNGTISFFSTTPVEDIAATNKTVVSILKTASGEVYFKAMINSFHFPKGLMEEHFNENYMESEKFPEAAFNGKINETIDYTKDGVYEVTATGILKIHGVEKNRTEKGTLTIKGKSITLHCELKAKPADFNIEIPKIVFQNIAEVIDVKIDITYEPYVKK